MCVPGLFRLAQISLTKPFHRSSAETIMIGKTKTKTATTTMTITLSQNVVLSDFNQILSLHTLNIHLFSIFYLGIIELIATHSYTTIQTCEYPLPASFLRKDNNHCHARCSRRMFVGQFQMISSGLGAIQVYVCEGVWQDPKKKRDWTKGLWNLCLMWWTRCRKREVCIIGIWIQIWASSQSFWPGWTQ